MTLFAGSFGIVPALDVDNPEQLDRIVQETTGVEGIAGYKVGLSSVMRFGLKTAVQRLRDLTDLPLLYDHQKAGPDMPDMAEKFTSLCKDAAVDGLILFPVAGPTAVDRFVRASIVDGLVPVVGGEIPVPDYGVSGGGYMLDDALDRILADANIAGADHFVLPAHDPVKIARWSGWIAAHVAQPTLFLTGFGALGGTIEAAFGTAAACSRRFAIVGRLITGSPTPGDAAARLIAEIAKAAG